MINGQDGKPRCAWAGAGDTPLGRYHDEVWGTRNYGESALFEALTLEREREVGAGLGGALRDRPGE